MTLPQSSYDLQNYLNIDVTGLVQDMVSDPDNSFGFMLRLVDETPTGGLMFYGGLAPEPDKVPSLVVVYGDCGGTNIGEVDGGSTTLSVTPTIVASGMEVRLDMGRATSGTDLVLLNALGQVVYRRPIGTWPMRITVPTLAAGSYTWNVQSTTGAALGVARMVVRQ